MRINNHSAETQNNLEMKINESRSEKSGRVNINNLLSKVRADHKKQKKENLVFVGLIGSIVVITGIIASL
tara:strand:- start:292 stop:501 length:210 start_codon:yes stop_codon:yes gene_type:complete